MVTPNVRLLTAMKSKGFPTPTEFANRFREVNQNTIISHTNGNRDISKKAAEKYARLLGCTAGWILYGEGPAPEVSTEPGGDGIWKGRINTAVAEAVRSGVDIQDVVDALLDAISTIRLISERQPDRIALAKEVVRRAREQSHNPRTSGKEDTEAQR